MSYTNLHTIPDIARNFGLKAWRVNYAVKKHEILERSRAGLVRLFDDKQAKQIAELTLQIRTRGTA